MALALAGVDAYDAMVAAAGWIPIITATANGWRGIYYDRFDRVYAAVTSTYPAMTTSGPGWWDPYFLSGVAPQSQRFVSAPNWTAFAVGEWNRIANTQVLYGRNASSTIEIVNATSLETAGSAGFTNVGWSGTLNGKTSTQDGYWATTSTTRFIFFETLGYCLVVGATQVRFGGVTYSNVVVQVDLVTGDGVPVSGLPCRHNASPTIYQAAEAFGDSFTLDECQFVPDDDSTPAQPKGFLLFSHSVRIATGDAVRDYVRFVDWNPSGKVAAAGTPSRVHKRLTQLTRMEYSDGATGAYPTGLGGGTTQAHQAFTFYHPPTRLLSIMKTSNANPFVANRSALRGRFATTPAVTAVMPPAPTRAVATGSVVPFVVTAVGSLGERISGVDVTFALQRGSTFEEALTIGAPGSSSAVAQTMDNDPEFQPIVKKNGVALTPTTHYTVDYVNNEIDFVAPEPVGGSVYSVTYRHRSDPASPSHGSLLNAQASTDENGEAIARVRYADDADLVGMVDALTAST